MRGFLCVHVCVCARVCVRVMAASSLVDPTDVLLRGSQEKNEDKKVTQARQNVGEALLQFLKDQKVDVLSRDMLKQFVRQQMTIYAPTTVSTRLSHALKFAVKHFHVRYTKDELKPIYDYINRKLYEYEANKASTFSHENVKTVCK